MPVSRTRASAENTDEMGARLLPPIGAMKAAHFRPGATCRLAILSASTTNSKSPNSFRAFSRLPAAPVLAGLRGFASRALLFPFRRFFALHGLSVLRFYLYASRACARPLLELMRVSGRSVVVGNSCSGGDRSLPLHQVQASENAFFTLEPAGWPIHPARPIRPLVYRPASGGNAAVSRPSASGGLERPLSHRHYSRTRPRLCGNSIFTRKKKRWGAERGIGFHRYFSLARISQKSER